VRKISDKNDVQVGRLGTKHAIARLAITRCATTANKPAISHATALSLAMLLRAAKQIASATAATSQAIWPKTARRSKPPLVKNAINVVASATSLVTAHRVQAAWEACAAATVAATVVAMALEQAQSSAILAVALVI